MKFDYRYFDADDEDHRIPDLEYQPAPGSPSANKQSDSDDSDDPLEAFMAGIEVFVYQYWYSLGKSLSTFSLHIHPCER